jgi:repressor LexA
MLNGTHRRCAANERLARGKGRIVLRPENKAYPVIRPKGDLEIFGVVVGQFRKYR